MSESLEINYPFTLLKIYPERRVLTQKRTRKEVEDFFFPLVENNIIKEENFEIVVNIPWREKITIY